MNEIVGEAMFFRPGHVRITLNAEHRRAYRRLYGQSFPLADVPAIKNRDFDGRSITMTRRDLTALNQLFRTLVKEADLKPRDAFGDQGHSLTAHFKEMQFLS